MTAVADTLQHGWFGVPCFGETHSGDAAVARERDGDLLVAVVDALGHGREAYDTAVVAERYLELAQGRDVLELLDGLHRAMRDTRGAAVTLALVPRDAAEVHAVCVGNVRGWVYAPGRARHRLNATAGLVGVELRAAVPTRHPFSAGDALVVASDGVSETAVLDGVLGADDARSLARDIVLFAGRRHDDATCLVVRRRP